MRRVRARSATAGGGSSAGVRLIAPNVLVASGYTSFVRAQAGSVTSVSLGSDGTTWSEVAADVPRFYGTDTGLLIEGDGTNLVRNPRGHYVSGAIGSTTRPANWTNITTAGFAPTYDSFQTNSGIPCVRITYNATATGTTTVAFSPETTTAITAASGDLVRASIFIRVQSATTPPGSYIIRLQARDSGGTVIGGGTTTQTITPDGTLTNYTVSATMPATTASVSFEWGFTVTNATAYNFTLDIGAPMVEIPAASRAISTPALNPAGTTTAPNARGADLVTGVVSTLFPSGVGTLLMKAVLPANADGTDQMLLQMDDGTTSNRIRLRNSLGGANILFGKVVGGTSTNATSLGTMTAGTAFKVGLSWDGTTIYGNLNGGTTQSITGSITSPLLTVLRVGMATGAGNPMFGRVLYLDALPYAVPDLATAVTGLP